MTQIHAPDAKETIWVGTYGSAVVCNGRAQVVTSDGVRHTP